MTRRLGIILTTLLMGVLVQAQTNVLADFEDGTYGQLKRNTDFTGSLFATKPTIMDNPKKDGTNPSSKCVGAVNVANADWYKNFLILDLNEPVTITDENRVLTLLAYRSIQPKEMRIGVNGYEETDEVYYGKLAADSQWERVSVDLGQKFYGQTLRTIYIVLSCNWGDPRTGWGEATYCFDDITLGEGEALPNASVTIDISTTYQTIQDFGASDCWTAEFISDYFDKEQKEKGAKWLFSQNFDAQGNPEGIGLSCWRVNLGAGSAAQGGSSNIEDETRRGECFLKEDGTYDWSRCDGQQWFMQQAREYGVDHFLLFSNSAPVYYTKSGKANTNNQNMSCNLKDDCYDDFAEFLTTTTRHFVDEGYNVTYIDPVNEPQYDWKDGQEGSPWENANIAKLAKELDKSLQSRGLDTKILVTEAGSWEYLYGGSGRATKQIEALFAPASASYIGDLPSVSKTVAAHSYWTFTTNNALQQAREKAREAAEKYGVELMQTEWSMLDAAPAASAGFPASYDAASKMDIALYMGKLIWCDLTFANAVGWSYWTAFAQEKWSQKNRFYLIRMNAKGDTGDESYGDIKKGGTLTADKNLWVLGNYSRFIRPGYRRVAVGGADELNGLMASAWLSPDGNEVVTVLVNMNRAVRKISLSADNISDFEHPVGYLTDKDHNLERMASIDVTDIEVPSRSVLTVVMGLGSSGIHDVVGEASGRSGIYTLSGQRLTTVPQKGIYIRDGKKYISK